jgi:hypothetical protein
MEEIINKLLKKEKSIRQKESDRKLIDSKSGVKLFQDSWNKIISEAQKLCENEKIKNIIEFDPEVSENSNSFKIKLKKYYLNFHTLYEAQNSAKEIAVGIKLIENDFDIPAGFRIIKNYQYKFIIENNIPIFQCTDCYDDEILIEEELIEKHIIILCDYANALE